MNIRISTQILDGNLGDGWTDDYEAALALAEYTKRIWLSDLQQYLAAGHTVEIDIDVERNTSGCSRGMSVDIEDPGDPEDIFRDMDLVENLLTDENVIWERFCSSDDAQPHIA